MALQRFDGPGQAPAMIHVWGIFMHNYQVNPRICFHCQAPYARKIVENQAEVCRTTFVYPCGFASSTDTTPTGTTCTITVPATREKFDAVKAKYDALPEAGGEGGDV